MKKVILFTFVFLAMPFQLSAQWVNQDKKLPDLILSSGKTPPPLEVIMYFSFSCPHCAQFHNESWDKFITNYVNTGKVRLVIRDVALDQISYFASTYAHMIGIEHYLQIMQLCMKHQNEWVRQKDRYAFFLKMVAQEGLPQIEEDKIHENKSVSDLVLARWVEAKKKYYLDGTPAFIINGKIYNYYMPWGEFEAKIKEALQPKDEVDKVSDGLKTPSNNSKDQVIQSSNSSQGPSKQEPKP